MSKINLVTLSNEKLAELASQHGLQIPEGTSRQDVIAAVSEAIAKADGPEQEPDQKPQAKPKKQIIFYWVKFPTYMNDKDVCGPGLYRTAAPIPRFDRSDPKYVNRFDDEVPETILYEIAKMLNVSVEITSGNKRNFRDAEDILEEIVIDR